MNESILIDSNSLPQPKVGSNSSDHENGNRESLNIHHSNNGASSSSAASAGAIVNHDDLCYLDKVSEQAVLDNFQRRFNNNQIYTRIGEQIISINPFNNKHLTNIGDTKENALKHSYRNKYIYEMPPHIYQLAEDAYKKMLSNGNQCIIITGESGSGKTEASKIVMDYISHYHQNQQTSSKNNSNNNSNNNIMKRILDSNILLEAFGNAKTIRNENSSRFGKYITINFDAGGVPLGGKITQFLLEKSRIHSRAAGERNFHIFYQLLTDKQLVDKYKLNSDSSSYAFLAGVSHCSVDDHAGFKRVLECLKSLDWTDKECDFLWRTLSAILLIGNLEFEVDSNRNVDSVVISSQDLLKRVAQLLECDMLMLEKALISRSLTTGMGKRKSNIHVLLDLNQAKSTRDSLAKVLYDRLFQMIFEQINRAIQSEAADQEVYSMGILDIYGFELFENNSFEQFIINYTNEKLQQLFIQLVLKQEQEEYKREGIEWLNIDYFENDKIIELIEGQPVGLLKLLDEACMVGQTTKEQLLQKFNRFFQKHPNYESSEMDQQRFTLKHYAGPVSYDLEHFIAKNRDPLNQDLLTTLQHSSDPILSSLFPSLNCSGSRKIPTMAGHQFKQSINDLIVSLQQSEPHYIRCIKSNDEKLPLNFNLSLVRNQIRYLNIVETVRVRKAGYCQKYHYTKFFSRYKICSPITWNNKYDKSPKEGCTDIIKSFLPAHERQVECFFGVKKIFIKSARILYLFEKLRYENLPKAAITIQRVWRGFVARLWFKKELERLRLEKEEIQRHLLQKRSAVKIANVYYRYKMRSFLSKLVPWTQQPYYNKGRQMPSIWKQRRAFEDYLVLIHNAWWAKVKVGKLTPEQRALVRQKILALDLFGSGHLRKKEWDPKRRFIADYMSDDSNPKKAQFIEAIQSLFPSGDDKEILFADNVIKVNKRGKCQLRTLIITDQHIYKYDPKKYTRKKVGLKIHLIVALSASSKRDTFLAIHFKPPVRDLFIDLGCDGCEKYSEVATILVQQVFKLTRNTTPLLLREPVTFNNSRDSRNSGSDWVITFSPYPKGKDSPRQCTFTKSKTNTALVYYQENQ